MRSLIAFTLIVASATAFAAPHSVADCEQIQGADAYNHCLASFGPKMHQQHFTNEPRAYEYEDNHPGGGAHVRRVHSQVAGGRDRHGRMHMEFIVRH